MSQIFPSTPMQSSRISTMRKRKFYLLFLFLLAYLILYPYIQNRGFEYLGFRIFGVSVTLLSVYAVSFRRRFMFVALVLAVPALVQRLLLPRGNEGTLAVLGIVSSFVFDLFIVVVIFRRVFRSMCRMRKPSSALCVFTFFWVSVLPALSSAGHGAAQSLLPRSGLKPPPSSQSLWSHLL